METLKTWKLYYRYLYLRFLLFCIIEFLFNCYLKLSIKNKKFTIISNNCWGGGIYKDLKLKYNTPTVGLFFFTPCYIKFVENIKFYIKKELIFINYSKYQKANELRIENKYPIGQLNNEIEIHFLHYTNETEAKDKWDRRKVRINYKNINLSLTDNEHCNLEEIKIFDKLPYNKVFFSSKFIPNINSLIWLKQYEKDGKIGDIYTNKWEYRKYFNVSKWLNKRP